MVSRYLLLDLKNHEATEFNSAVELRRAYNSLDAPTKKGAIELAGHSVLFRVWQASLVKLPLFLVADLELGEVHGFNPANVQEFKEKVKSSLGLVLPNPKVLTFGDLRLELETFYAYSSLDFG